MQELVDLEGHGANDEALVVVLDEDLDMLMRLGHWDGKRRTGDRQDLDQVLVD